MDHSPWLYYHLQVIESPIQQTPGCFHQETDHPLFPRPSLRDVQIWSPNNMVCGDMGTHSELLGINASQARTVLCCWLHRGAHIFTLTPASEDTRVKWIEFIYHGKLTSQRQSVRIWRCLHGFGVPFLTSQPGCRPDKDTPILVSTITTSALPHTVT